MRTSNSKSHRERHRSDVTGWLRAAVLGANDGVVSTASLVLGVAAANGATATIVTAGLAGLVGGALSMAAGEYVSVSSQRDAERADLLKERSELAAQPEAELIELTHLYMAKGLEEPLARKVATALSRNGNALEAHAREELGIDPHALAQPARAAFVSAIAFALGAALPLGAMALTPEGLRMGVTLGAAVITLAALGSWSARLGGAPIGRALVRVIIGGTLAMALTMGLGLLFGQAG